ncbi:TIGR04282 family arsenosugar biosynthesis glycosyltransferase [Candidatus Cyanaurora vandensis]|uniref:TIGR04282 family arsenosugar biosynthesis glycosyltransferase n=1 Tax=Candidatus Cyanaurora vandensis TaxID=2714958 RepID=UPI00257BFF3F|nr:TIGR04282 family arsenosugar biosynthesis glycosyltransferase [Candidatus Cyanaurora vandensis]
MTAVLLMAKAPEVGQVKTRLCPPLDLAQACLFHEALLRDTLNLLRAVSSSRYLAYSGSRDWFDYHSPDFYLFRQQGEDLGVRLHHSLQFMLRWHEPVLCIGSDSPHLPPAYLQQAAQLLEQYPVVLGPALDGGYYLIGLNRFEPLFLGMPMGTDQLFTATQTRCQELGLGVGLLPPLGDLDYWSDVQSQRPHLPQGHTTRLLAQWEGHLPP